MATTKWSTFESLMLDEPGTVIQKDASSTSSVQPETITQTHQSFANFEPVAADSGHEGLVESSEQCLSPSRTDRDWGILQIPKQEASKVLSTWGFQVDGRWVGELAAKHEAFCPILAVAKFPYKYLQHPSATSESVSREFFAAGKFWTRCWTIYYIHPPNSLSNKPIFLVPASEVQALLDEINLQIQTRLQFPDRIREPGFNLLFNKDGGRRPRFLGKSNSREVYTGMESRVPSYDFKILGETDAEDHQDDHSFFAFKGKMEAALAATKAKSKIARDKKKIQRVHTKDRWCSQLRRTQRYLGLRPLKTEAGKKDPYSIPNLTWSELEQKVKEHKEALEYALPNFDLAKPAPYPFDNSVVFISVDIEAAERNHSCITEIGISTLDTNDLLDVAPGPGGGEWMTRIKARHFRIKEYLHVVNKEFVQGCADKFEKQFGASEFISINDATKVIASCFRPPFSGVLLEGNVIAEDPQVKRKIVLVGHNTSTDVEYLRTLGYDINNLSNLLEILDTADIFRALTREPQARSLGALLVDLGLTGWNLHNAGNDAAYTLQALIGTALKGMADKDERRATHADRETKIEEAKKLAEEKVINDEDEWDVADVEDDGGVPLVTPPKRRKSSVKEVFATAERNAAEPELTADLVTMHERMVQIGLLPGHLDD